MAIDSIYTLHVLCSNSNTALTAQNQFHFKQNSESISVQNGKDLVDAWRDVVDTAYRGCLAGDYHTDGWTVVEHPSGNLVYEESDLALNNGALTGEMMSPVLAMILSYKTAHLGRSGRGRMFLGPMTESENDSTGRPNASGVTAAGTLATEILAMTDGDTGYAGFDWGLWSEKDQAFYPVTSYTIRPYWATQRGRRR